MSNRYEQLQLLRGLQLVMVQQDPQNVHCKSRKVRSASSSLAILSSISCFVICFHRDRVVPLRRYLIFSMGSAIVFPELKFVPASCSLFLLFLLLVLVPCSRDGNQFCSCFAPTNIKFCSCKAVGVLAGRCHERIHWEMAR